MSHDRQTERPAATATGSTNLSWAGQLGDIPAILAVRADLRAAMRFLLEHHEIPVKVTEGGDRRARRKAILDALFAGTLTVDAAIAEVERRLGRADSPHGNDNRVFASGWPRRLVHTHTSVFYTWSVLEFLLASGARQCFVPHVPVESEASACSRLLAGQAHDAAVLRDRLIQVYVAKQPARAPLIPNHPHCTHVVTPVPPGHV
jgi:hypothetical protein